VNNHAAYHAPVDGPAEQSVFALPVSDPDAPLASAIVLQGKHRPLFFTDMDEKVCVQLAPFVITSLKACESIEHGLQAVDDVNRWRQRLQTLLESTELLAGQLHLPRLIATIRQTACRLVDTDQCELFEMNDWHDRLLAWNHSGGRREMSVLGGLAGAGAATSQVVNIKDAQEDPRVDRSSDIATGDRTQTVLCVPIAGAAAAGITQLVNKFGGVFTARTRR
jgi:hypothetical protein